MAKFSVIISTLNEENYIGKTIGNLLSFKKKPEIIIIDGGSNDETINIVKKFNLKIIHSKKGRGEQLNKGGKNANGEILVFLHADTRLPENAFELIEKYFENPETKIALFKLGFDSDNILLNFYTRFTSVDSVFTSFGDQAIIIRKEFYYKLGGFPDQPIFEDVELLRKARKITRVIKLPAAVITSARRFNKQGIIKTQLKNVYYFALYFMGVKPDKLYKQYFKLEK